MVTGGSSADLAALFAAADTALREAKRAGRDRALSRPDLGESFRSIASSVSSRAEIILALALYRVRDAAKGSGGDQARSVRWPLAARQMVNLPPATERPKYEVHGNCLHAANRPAADAGGRAGRNHRQRRSISVERHLRVGDQNAPFDRDLQIALDEARRKDLAVSVAGGRHAMGGQQFASDAMLLDTKNFNQVVQFDRAKGQITVEAGIEWPELIDYLQAEQAGQHESWAIREKQTGVDRVSVGGSLASNIHGRGLKFPPMVSCIESFTLLTADGKLHYVQPQPEPGTFFPGHRWLWAAGRRGSRHAQVGTPARKSSGSLRSFR